MVATVGDYNSRTPQPQVTAVPLWQCRVVLVFLALENVGLVWGWVQALRLRPQLPSGTGWPGDIDELEHSINPFVTWANRNRGNVHHSRITLIIQMIRLVHPRALTVARLASAVVCVLLILFIGFVSAVHSHPDAARTPEHSCSVCALAHAGVVPVQLSAPLPIFTSTALRLTVADSPHSLLLVSALHIRPPPVA